METIVTRKTRSAAENYIRRLGYVPGHRTQDTTWNGSETVAVWMTFDVERTDDGHAVTRKVEDR